jgi:hypothetical protein
MAKQGTLGRSAIGPTFRVLVLVCLGYAPLSTSRRSSSSRYRSFTLAWRQTHATHNRGSRNNLPMAWLPRLLGLGALRSAVNGPWRLCVLAPRISTSTASAFANTTPSRQQSQMADYVPRLFGFGGVSVLRVCRAHHSVSSRPSFLAAGRKICYLPIQNVLKIRFKMSSVVVAPVIASSGRSAL